MSTPRRLLIASNNRDKVDELRRLLEGSGWEIVAPADLGLRVDVNETGETYADNARLKAAAFMHASGLPALADDSGLEVDALNGEPGALHHLHGWDGEDQADRLRILLEAMEEVPDGQRSGRFRAVIVVTMPDGAELIAEGVLEGEIARVPSGEGGFGYDPVMYVPSLDATVAELSLDAKNAISHRGRAARNMVELLKQHAASHTD
jgi:XTP/dITP diphosphohydrolase